MSWSVIVTQDIERKKKLYKIHRGQEMILEAPVVLTFCADHQRTWSWLEAHQAKLSFDDFLGFLKGAFDAVIASQTIALAAESRGLGICYMGTTLWAADEIIELLEIPEGVFPVTAFVLGYPNEKPAQRDRLPLSAIIHHEKYQKWTPEKARELYRSKDVSGWNRIRTFSGVADKMDKEGIQSLAQYYTSDLKYGKKLHREVSQMLTKYLIKQRFWNHE